MTECLVCGASISDELLHSEWHATVDLRISLLENASGVSPDRVIEEAND
jgi:hypothetical protein